MTGVLSHGHPFGISKKPDILHNGPIVAFLVIIFFRITVLNDEPFPIPGEVLPLPVISLGYDLVDTVAVEEADIPAPPRVAVYPAWNELAIKAENRVRTSDFCNISCEACAFLRINPITDSEICIAPFQFKLHAAHLPSGS